jgi:hypothetical protein
LRNLISAASLASLVLLAGCGANPDHGKSIKPGKKTSAAALSPAAGPVAELIQLSPCKTMSIYGGSNPALAADFSGSSACASTSHLNVVRIRVSANLPTTARVCVVPLNFSNHFPATCQTINGQADVVLSTGEFTAVTLVYENQLASYQSYLNG